MTRGDGESGEITDGDGLDPGCTIKGLNSHPTLNAVADGHGVLDQNFVEYH